MAHFYMRIFYNGAILQEVGMFMRQLGIFDLLPDGETGDTLYQRQLLNVSLLLHFTNNTHSIKNFKVGGIEKNCGDNFK